MFLSFVFVWRPWTPHDRSDLKTRRCWKFVTRRRNRTQQRKSLICRRRFFDIKTVFLNTENSSHSSNRSHLSRWVDQVYFRLLWWCKVSSRWSCWLMLFISVELNLNSVQRHFFCQPGPRFLIMIDYFRAEDDDDKYSW